MSRKNSLILAVVLLLGGLVLLGYAVERYNASQESYSLSSRQAAESGQLEPTNIERATELMEFAADNAAMGNGQRSSSYLWGGLGAVLVIAAGFLMKKRQQ